MYKLIAIDLDGTLLDDKKKISRENIDTINSLVDRGCQVVFATGRRYYSAKNFLEAFGRDFLIIANNGNMIRHTGDNKIIHTDHFNNEYLEYILELGKKNNMHPILHVASVDEKKDLMGELDKQDKRYFKYLEHEPSYDQVKSLVEADPEILSIVYLGDYRDLKPFEDEILKAHPGQYRTYLQGNLQNAEVLLEIVNPTGSKWNSIAWYARENGIEEDEIIVFGDDINDIDMIESAGLGVAMKNSAPSILEAADYITEYDNNESGVGRTLRKIFEL